MTQERFKIIASVYLLFVKDGKILLLRRANTGYEDGNYGLVAGHLDEHEPLTQAAIREAKEESGAIISPADLELKVVMHRKGQDGRMDFFFEVKKWQGKITNTEPKKCSDLSWFSLNNLPPNTIPYIKEAITCYQKGIAYSEFGW